jgi:hypothetical protein
MNRAGRRATLKAAPAPGRHGAGTRRAGPEARAGTADQCRLASRRPLALVGEESFRGPELAVEARNAAGGVFGRRSACIRSQANHPAQTALATRVLMSLGRMAAVLGIAASVLPCRRTRRRAGRAGAATGTALRSPLRPPSAIRPQPAQRPQRRVLSGSDAPGRVHGQRSHPFRRADHAGHIPGERLAHRDGGGRAEPLGPPRADPVAAPGRGRQPVAIHGATALAEPRRQMASLSSP